MLGLLTMFVVLAVIGTIGFAAIILVATLVKATVHVALLPLKLLFLPFVAVILLVKLAVIIAVGAVLFAIVLPLLIIGAIVAAPFLIVSALT